MPYTESVDGARLVYRMELPDDIEKVTIHVATKSTLAFHDPSGHSYRVGFKGGNAVERCFNDDLNVEPLDPGIVFEKFVIDFGGYEPSYLMGEESPYVRK